MKTNIFMKKTLILMLALVSFLPIVAQNARNQKADGIVGNYYVKQGSDESKVKFFKAADGTDTCQITWLKDLYDKNGNVYLDEKNPDKSLRNVPCDKIVLISGLKYNAKKQQWDGAKIYDPQRGIKANVVCLFTPEGRLKVYGSIMGFGETVYWDPIKE